MCGRFALGISISRIMEMFGITDAEEHASGFRYNIAPTDTVPGVVRNDATNGRRLAWFRWGLVPGWADDSTIGARMINARADTVQRKPAFRDAFRERRCLIPASGFYEWEKRPGARLPWFIRRRDGDPMVFAGLWEAWRRGGESLTTCSIITTDANELVAPLHDRMPVVLDRPAWDVWLDPAVPAGRLVSLLAPPLPELLDRYRVSPLVNNVRNDDPSFIEPLPENGTLDL